MIDRTQAIELISQTPVMTCEETVPLKEAIGRTLSQPVTAKITQPPASMSAMDGYAVRFEDTLSGVSLRVIGEASAGAPYQGHIEHGECVRVFTGSVIPSGADHVIIQEDVDRSGNEISIQFPQDGPRHIRKAGIDFSEGDELITAGTMLAPRHLSICAAANHAELVVLRRPRIAILSNGNELKPPGSKLKEGEIIASNEYSLSALIETWGGEALPLGIAPDDPAAIDHMLKQAKDIDVFVPVGGASVGDYDYMKPAFEALGFELVFSKVAIRPGKPTWFARKASQTVIGLPGNPASSLVCAHIFLRHLIATLLSQRTEPYWMNAKLNGNLEANGKRESFLRGHLNFTQEGEVWVTPAHRQDSSLLSPFIKADVLIQRQNNASGLSKGSLVPCLRLT